MAVGKPLHLRLFLEGIEVPVVAAQISINVNAPAVAAIQIVPIDQGMNFHPRTMVHLFFLDYISRTVEIGPNQPSLEKNYKLLFSGEVVGFSFVQTPQSRGLVLQCLDFSSYWDAAHATAIEYGPAGNLFSNMASLYSGDASQFDDIVNQQAEKLVQWLKQKPQTKGLETVSGLAGGIIHMLEVMGGVPKHSKGINDFFTVAELRCKLLQQITAEENDNTAANLLKVKVFDQWLRNGLQNMGQQVTFRDMMKMLFQYIYYEVVPNPAAKFDQEVVGQKATTKTAIGSHPIAIKAVANLKSIMTSLQAKATDDQDHLLDLSELAKTYSDKVSKVAVSLDKNLHSQTSKQVDYLRQAEKILKNDRISWLDVRSWIQKAINDLSVTSTPVKGSAGKLSRLRTQIIRPDCWFVAPPRCNVIFPEQFTQLSYDRMFIQEVTRSLMMIYDTLIGKDHLLADRILFPNIGSHTKALTKSVGTKSYRVLMDHELHTGIIPRSEWIPNTTAGSSKAESSDKSTLQGYRLGWAAKVGMFHFFKYRFGPRQASVGGRFNPYVVCGFPAIIIKQPFIVPNKPADDTPEGSIIDFVAQQAKEHGAPDQLVGMVGAISHNIDQSGGTTSISMHHVRRHSGVDDEFLGTFLKEKGTRKKSVRVVLKKDSIENDVRLAKLLVEVTPQSDTPPKTNLVKTSSKTKQVEMARKTKKGDKFVSETVTATINSRQEETVTKVPGTRTQRVEGKSGKISVPFPNGSKTVGSKGVFGTITRIQVLDSTLIQITPKSVGFSVVVLHEDVSLPDAVGLPIEEIMRPTFFSDKYSNAKIGSNIYQPFFGVGSIVDEVSIDSVSTPSEPVDGVTVEPTKKLEDLIQEFTNQESIKSQASIERAVNFISYVYGMVKSQGKDVDDFVSQYGYRPIATLVDMLGSSDLEISVSGTKAQVDRGTIGFHSAAVSEKLVEAGSLTGLLDDTSTQLKRVDGGEKGSSVPPQYDVRKAKRDRVLAYVEVLMKSTGLQG